MNFLSWLKVLVSTIALFMTSAQASGWQNIQVQPSAWASLQTVGAEGTMALGKGADAVGDSATGPTTDAYQCPPEKWIEVCSYKDVTTTKCALTQAACATITYACVVFTVTPQGKTVCAVTTAVCVPGLVNMCNPVTESKYVCERRCS